MEGGAKIWTRIGPPFSPIFLAFYGKAGPARMGLRNAIVAVSKARAPADQKPKEMQGDGKVREGENGSGQGPGWKGQSTKGRGSAWGVSINHFKPGQQRCRKGHDRAGKNRIPRKCSSVIDNISGPVNGMPNSDCSETKPCFPSFFFISFSVFSDNPPS
jgi:hypothetical protein